MYDKLVNDNSTPCHICNKELVKIKCVIIVICLASLEVQLVKPAIKNTRFQSFSQLYFTIFLTIIASYLLKHWKKAMERLLAYEVMKKITFLSRNRSSLTNLLIRQEKEVNVKRELRFIDCWRFMASRLNKLSSNLKIDQFVNLKKYYSGNQLSLLLRKGVYQYHCLLHEKFDETSLPPKKCLLF